VRNKNSQKYPGYLTYQLFVSDAFRYLKPAAKDILLLLYFEIKISSGKSRSKKYTPIVINRHEIKLPYADIKEGSKVKPIRPDGYSDKTIWTSFNQLLAHGFIKVIKIGGGHKGEVSVYEIKEDWREWKPGQIIHKRQRSNRKIGWQKKES
jgi:hypothetical protein